MLEIERPLAPLREGTQATIRIASLSGVANRYVDLQLPPGEENDTIADGGADPARRTPRRSSTSTTCSRSSTSKTRKGLRNVIRGFGASYAGRARQANQGWEYLNPSLVGARRLFEELSYDQKALESFVVDNAQAGQRHRRAPRRRHPARRPARDDLRRDRPGEGRAPGGGRRAAGLHAPRELDVREPARDARRPRPADRREPPGDAEAARRPGRAASRSPAARRRRSATSPRSCAARASTTT